jgi:hypothetical protein
MEKSFSYGLISTQQDADEMRNKAADVHRYLTEVDAYVDTDEKVLTIANAAHYLSIGKCEAVFITADEDTEPFIRNFIIIEPVEGRKQRMIIIEDENVDITNLACNVTIILNCERCRIFDNVRKAQVVYNGKVAKPCFKSRESKIYLFNDRL